MSLEDFLLSVRTGARLIAPSAFVDSPSLDASGIERILKGAHLWLTPKSVAGFDEKDFDFLTPEERRKLSECVGRFRQVASQVPRNEPASDRQVQQALPEFRCILEILRPDKYADPESLMIGKRLEHQLGGRLPGWVRELRIEAGEDATGGPAAWIWVIVDDEAAQQSVFAKNTKMLHELLLEALGELGVQRWPYIRFRTVSEQELPPAKEKNAKR